jgi:hypothetical protein
MLILDMETSGWSAAVFNGWRISLGRRRKIPTAEKVPKLRSAWTDECVRPYTSTQSKSRQLALTAEC